MTLEARSSWKARSGVASLNFAAAAACAAVSLWLASDCALASTYLQTNLVSDIPGLAANTDPNLANPWGMAFTPASPFWISDQATNVATLYNSAGTPQGLVVSTPPSPTGDVFNPTQSFVITDGARVNFRDGNETTAYYIDSLQDAVNAAVEMARKRALELLRAEAGCEGASPQASKTE